MALTIRTKRLRLHTFPVPGPMTSSKVDSRKRPDLNQYHGSRSFVVVFICSISTAKFYHSSSSPALSLDKLMIQHVTKLGLTYSLVASLCFNVKSRDALVPSYLKSHRAGEQSEKKKKGYTISIARESQVSKNVGVTYPNVPTLTYLPSAVRDGCTTNPKASPR